jgi:hypothetical protein
MSYSFHRFETSLMLFLVEGEWFFLTTPTLTN